MYIYAYAKADWIIYEMLYPKLYIITQQNINDNNDWNSGVNYKSEATIEIVFVN